jgi:putative ABC transport system permease protein
MIRVGMSQILSSMRHRKSAYSSLVLEVALGCTVVAYALGLRAAIRDVSENSLGFDEDRTFAVSFEAAPAGGFDARVRDELDALRALPGVAVAAAIESPPLSRRELPETAMTPTGTREVWTLVGGDQIAAALGARLAAGRWLTARDVAAGGPTPVLVSRELASHLGPRPLGASLSSPGLGSLSVVGVVDAELRINPFHAAPSELVIVPAHLAPGRRTSYLVRTSLLESSNFAASALARLSGARPNASVQVERIADIRAEFVRNVSGANTIILITVLGMILVVLVGSIGMASSLIVERTRQIGIRRALGARKVDIVGYFMLENLVATVLGVVIGGALCASLDYALGDVRGVLVIGWRHYLPIAAGLFLVTGQISVLLPAHRAACGACSAGRPRIA